MVHKKGFLHTANEAYSSSSAWTNTQVHLTNQCVNQAEEGFTGEVFGGCERVGVLPFHASSVARHTGVHTEVL